MPESQTVHFRIGILGAFIAPLVFVLGATTYFVYFHAFDMNALTMSGLVGLLIAGLFSKDYTAFWESVVNGIASTIAITVIMILLVVGPLATLLETTKVSEGFVWLASSLGVSGGLYIASVFVAACAMSMSTGTSLGTIFTAFPIFYPAGAALDANPVLLAGAILSGALFGDNLAPISDTTIVSSTTQRYRRRAGAAEISGVVASRAKYSISTAVICLVLYGVIGSLVSGSGESQASTSLTDSASPVGLVMLVPVTVLLVVAFWKRNLYLAITVGIAFGVVTALVFDLLTLQGIVSVEDGKPVGFLVEGVSGMLPLIGLSLVVFGMLGVLQSSGTLELIVHKLTTARLTNGPAGAELSIGLGQSVVTALFAGVVGPSIVTFGPVADRVGGAAGLHPYRRANIMECFAMGIPCVVPAFSAFLFICSQLTEGHGGMPGLAPASLFIATFYPLVLTLVMASSVLTGWGRRFEGADGAPLRARPTSLDAAGASDARSG